MKKRYSRRSTDALVKKLEQEGYKLTDNPYEALYILDDGRMIDGEFDCGLRGLDHRMIEAFVDGDRYDDEEFWIEVHRRYRLVRMIPETKIALIKGKQRLTEAQKQIIEQIGFTVEVY